MVQAYMLGGGGGGALIQCFIDSGMIYVYQMQYTKT